jgi:hypothetical protein
MNKTSKIIEAVISFPPEYVKDLRKIRKLQRIIKKYYVHLFDFSTNYSEKILSCKVKHDKPKHAHFHFLLIPTNKNQKKSNMEANHE